MTRFPTSDRERVALAAILALAAVLRLVGIRYGLPLAVLNPDEASIVPARVEDGHTATSTRAGTTTRRS